LHRRSRKPIALSAIIRIIDIAQKLNVFQTLAVRKCARPDFYIGFAVGNGDGSKCGTAVKRVLRNERNIIVYYDAFQLYAVFERARAYARNLVELDFAQVDTVFKRARADGNFRLKAYARKTLVARKRAIGNRNNLVPLYRVRNNNA